MADSKISDLAAITTLAGTEEFVVADSGATKKITAADVGTSLVIPAYDPVESLFGAPATAFEFDTSSLAGLTALSPTPDVADADTTVPGHLYIQDNAAGTSMCGYYATAPSAPFTAIALLADATALPNYAVGGLFVGVATPGAFEIVGPALAGNTMHWVAFNTPTSQGGAASFTPYHYPPIWLAVRVNSSTSVDFLHSANGRVWLKIRNDNPGFSIASVGLAYEPQNTGGIAVAFDYLRIWTSALTFPGV